MRLLGNAGQKRCPAAELYDQRSVTGHALARGCRSRTTGRGGERTGCGTSPVNSGGSGLTPTGEPLGTAGCGVGARNLSALARSADSAASPICMAGSRGDVACGCRLRLRDGG